MSDGIKLRVLGDFGPFSRMGKSISYQITIGTSSYLIDCGSPLFQQIGGYGLKNIKGLIITHCHDDHKRWFTDLALFNMYASDFEEKIALFTSEEIHDELIKASSPSLDRSLARDSKNIIDIPYDNYVNYQSLGPSAKYRIASIDEGEGKTGLYVKDSKGGIVGPDTAKIIISTKTKRPRMLFKDPDCGEWVEPESFYPFSSDVFYEKNKNILKDSEGFTFEAFKAPVWHGIPVIGVKIKTDKETLVFSSDTVNNKTLWEELYQEKRTPQPDMPKQEFESASVIYGDINKYIERVWSRGRYLDAVKTFDNAVVIHDVSIRSESVHTTYNGLKDTFLDKERVILTHAPDMIVSEWALCDTEKNFHIKGNSFFEIAGDDLYPMNADIYYKKGGRYWVGYKNDKGRYTVYEKDGILSLSREDGPDVGTPLYKVDLYEDISGMYFPELEEENVVYMKRKDLKVELVRFTEDGSTGMIIDSYRGRLSKR